MRLTCALSLAALIAVASPLSLGAAEVAFVVSPSMETDQEFKALEFTNGKWKQAEGGATEAIASVIRSNDRAFATVEVIGRDLASSVSVIFTSAISGKVLDTLTLDSNSSRTVKLSIPLVASDIDARVEGVVTGTSSVTLSRVLTPKLQNGVAFAIELGMTPITAFGKVNDVATQTLLRGAKSIALIQIFHLGEVSACTGFLVSPRMLATAAHCLRKLTGAVSFGKPQSEPCEAVGVLFDFTSASQGGAPTRAVHCTAVEFVGAVVRQRISLKAGTVAGQEPVFEPDLNDLAFITVDSARIGLPDGARRPPLSFGSMAPSSVGSLISYPQGGIEVMARDCMLQPVSGSAILHQCSTAPGSSGAPLLGLVEGKGLQVFGLHVCCNADSPDVGTFAGFATALRTWNLALSAKVINDFVGKTPENDR